VVKKAAKGGNEFAAICRLTTPAVAGFCRKSGAV
jgi:hypothetical protein